MELSSTDLVRVIFRSVPSPLSGQNASEVDVELLESKNLTNVPDALDRLEKLFLALCSTFPQVAEEFECLSSVDKAQAINKFQKSLGNLIAKNGEPPSSPYTDISDKLASLQFDVSFEVERINDTLSQSDKTNIRGIDPLTTFNNIRKTLEENSLLNELVNGIEQGSSLNKESFPPELGSEIDAETERSSFGGTKKKGEKRRDSVGLTTKRLLKSALVLTLLSLTVGPETPFNIKDQWDGGKNSFELVRAWRRPDEIKIYRDKYSDDPYVLPENVRKKQNTSPSFSGDDARASYKRVSEEGADKSSSSSNPLSNPFVLLLLYYLIRRYVVRPIYERQQGLLRGRNEVRHRQINSPFRGKPKEVNIGSIQTENPELRKKLWITSVWDPVSTSSVFRLDEDSPSIKIKHRGFRSWLVNFSTKFTFARALRTVPEVKPNLIGGINGSSRGLSLSRVLFPFQSESKRKIVWSKAIGIPDICKLSSRNLEEADVTYPVPPFPGNKVSLPVPAGYTIVGVNAPWNTRIERSTYGTWRVIVPIFFRGVIQYRVAPGGKIIVSDEDRDFIAAEAKRRANFVESNMMLLRSCETGNTPLEVVKELLTNQKKMGATLSYAPVHDHVRSVAPHIAADLFESYPDHTPETLAFSSVHKARSVGIPAIMATGYRLGSEDGKNTSFLVSERSPSILVPSSTKDREESYCEVDIYPTFDAPENCRPQSRVKDFLHAIPAFIVKVTGKDFGYIKIWYETFEFDRASEDLEELDLALESPITIKAAIVPTHNRSLDDLELKIKVSNAREIAELIKSESNFKEGEVSSESIDILVQENVRALQDRIVELANNEPTVRWWSKEESPIGALTYLTSCTKPVEYVDDDLKNPALLESQAAEVFFNVPEFQGCIARRKRPYLKLMCKYLNAKETDQTEPIFQKQKDFVESASEWLAKRSSSLLSGKRVVPSDSITDLGITVLSPLATWTLRSIENGFLSSVEGAKLFGNFAQSLRGAYSTLRPGVWDLVLLNSLFANPIDEQISSETYGGFLAQLSLHNSAQRILDSNGYPTEYGIKLLRFTLRAASSIRGTDINVKEITKAALITSSLNFLYFDMGRLWESEYGKPPLHEKIAASVSVPMAKFFKMVENCPPCLVESTESKSDSSEKDTVRFTPAASFEENSVAVSSLRLKKELAKGMLPSPPGVERNIEIRTATSKKTSSKYWLNPTSFQSFAVVNGKQIIGTLIMPSGCVWRKFFPETSALYEDVIGTTSEENEQSANEWFNTVEVSSLMATTAIRTLHLKTSEFPNRIRREISWMFHLLNSEVKKNISESDSSEAINKAIRDYFETWNNYKLPIPRAFLRLHDALSTVSDSQALEVKAVVSAWLECTLGKENKSSRLFPDSPSFYSKLTFSDENYDPFQENPISSFFEDKSVELHEELTLPVTNRILYSRTTTEEFLKREGFGERMTPRSGMEFLELKQHEDGSPLRDVNQIASARVGKLLINVRQNDESSRYLAWVDLSWLSQGISSLSLGSNIEKLLTFLYCCVREHSPITLQLFLDGEVVETMETRDLISSFSSEDKIAELINRLGGVVNSYENFIKEFGPIDETIVMLPKTPILGGVHTVLFAESDNVMALHELLRLRIRSMEGCSVVSSNSPQGHRFTKFHQNFEGTLV